MKHIDISIQHYPDGEITGEADILEEHCKGQRVILFPKQDTTTMEMFIAIIEAIFVNIKINFEEVYLEDTKEDE